MPLQLHVAKEVYPFNFPIELDANNGKDFPMFRDGEFYSTVRFLILSVMLSMGVKRATRSPRMNPDLGSGRGISYEAHFKHALIQMETGRKTAESPVLREKPAISPGNVSDGDWTPPRIYKKIISRDTKLAGEKELTNSNTHPACSLEDRNRADCFAVSLTGAEQAWIGKSGQAVSTLGYSRLVTRTNPAWENA